MSRRKANTTAPANTPNTTSAGNAVMTMPAMASDAMIVTSVLQEAEDAVEHQQLGDDCRLDQIAHHKFDDDRQFEHPGHRRPEADQRHLPHLRGGIRHGIRPDLRQAAVRCLTGQSEV